MYDQCTCHRIDAFSNESNEFRKIVYAVFVSRIYREHFWIPGLTRAETIPKRFVTRNSAVFPGSVREVGVRRKRKEYRSQRLGPRTNVSRFFILNFIDSYFFVNLRLFLFFRYSRFFRFNVRLPFRTIVPTVRDAVPRLQENRRNVPNKKIYVGNVRRIPYNFINRNERAYRSPVRAVTYIIRIVTKLGLYALDRVSRNTSRRRPNGKKTARLTKRNVVAFLVFIGKNLVPKRTRITITARGRVA